jgi:hypothetical protein
MIPTDELIFQRGRLNHQPDIQFLVLWLHIMGFLFSKHHGVDSHHSTSHGKKTHAEETNVFHFSAAIGASMPQLKCYHLVI